MAVTFGFLWAFAKVDANSHFTVLILISWLKFTMTSKMTTEEQKEPDGEGNKNKNSAKKGSWAKTTPLRLLLQQDIWFYRYLTENENAG